MKNIKLRTAIALSLVVGIVAPTIIAGWYTLTNRQQTMTAELYDYHRQITATLALAMQEPIWVLVPEKGLPLVNAIMTDHRVTQVTITSGNEVFIEKIREGGPVKNSLRLDQPVFYQDVGIGTVRTVLNADPLHTSLSKQRNEFILLTLVQLGVSLFIIFLLLNSKVLRPVNRLIVQSKKLAQGKLEENFDWEQTDELGLLGKSLDKARRELLNSFSKLNQLHIRALRNAEELAEARDQAEAANRIKNEFLDKISHELRTPLNGIMGMLQLMDSTALDERQREYAATALTASQKLDAVIEDILVLTKAETENIANAEEEFLLSDILHIVAERLRQHVLEKNITLHYSINKNVPDALLGDPGSLLQVLYNLTENGTKFTEQGEVHIQVDCEQAKKDEDRISLLFSISDTGIGIPKDKLQSIFEPFFQVSDGYSRKFQGTGMGLAIVKRLVETMGGQVSVESREGEGTTFRFSTLVKTLPQQAVEKRTIAALRQKAKPSRIKNIRVGLVFFSRLALAHF